MYQLVRNKNRFVQCDLRYILRINTCFAEKMKKIDRYRNEHSLTKNLSKKKSLNNEKRERMVTKANKRDMMTTTAMSLHVMHAKEREKGGTLLSIIHCISTMVKQLLKKWPLVDMLVLHES